MEFKHKKLTEYTTIYRTTSVMFVICVIHDHDHYLLILIFKEILLITTSVHRV